MKIDIEKMLMQVPITKIHQISDNEVFATLEKFNVCGSIKVKTMYWILKKSIEEWKLVPWKVLLEASSWNAAISLAYLAQVFWYEAELVVPKMTASCKKKLIMSYQAKLTEVEGDTDASIAYKNKLYEENKEKYFLTDQFNNLLNFDAHYNLTGPYIDEKLWKLDFIVAWLWTCGTLLWAGAYLKEKNPDLKIIAIDPQTRVEGIYNYTKTDYDYVIFNKYKHLIDEMIPVDFEHDAIKWINNYLEEGYFNGISSGAILVWAKKYLEDKKWLRGVIIAPDGGDYYFSEIFDKINSASVKWCK